MNPSTAQARAIVLALAKHGVRDVVLSPGSRNAGLAIALAQQSALRLHVRFDERTAGFTAVGMARASGVPVAVICTSGTAVANLTPAVFESHESGVPLLLLTADRPPEMRGRGANQTIDQLGIFGSALRAEFDLPLASNQDAVYWELAIANAISQSLGDEFTAPGPVQLNLPFAEPLVPDDADVDWVKQISLGNLPTPITSEPPELAPLLIDMKIDVASPRGVIICSDPRSIRPATALAKLLRWPMFVEPGGGARDESVAIQHYAKLADRPELLPDVVITCGRFGLSRAVNQLVNKVPQIAVGRFPLAADPLSHAAHHVSQVPLPIRVGPASDEWLTAWQAADKQLDQVEAEWNSRQVVDTVLQNCTANDLLQVAASQAIRLVDDLLKVGAGPRVLVNRGANGIDGLVASGSGAALMNASHKNYLLIGDVALLHDLSSLALPTDTERPRLQMVVLDNGGGGIFKYLEQGDAKFTTWFNQVFGTAHQIEIAKVGTALGWNSVQVNSKSELELALKDGAELIVAKLPQYK